ncbi:DUF4389 domain-containing protein [Candidatus Woesearchaeota archaeon]|nr:DUF4389 domain-containing protein [Candidatus Woesearchaeota archaeon]
MKTDRKEALMRIPVLIVSGIILGVWKMLIHLLAITNFFIALVVAKRNQSIADFCEIWNTQMYIFLRYATFVSNQRPFPFKPLTQNITKFEMTV